MQVPMQEVAFKGLNSELIFVLNHASDLLLYLYCFLLQNDE